MGAGYRFVDQVVKTNNLNTICEEAGCPNIYAVSYTHLTLPTILLV